MFQDIAESIYQKYIKNGKIEQRNIKLKKNKNKKKSCCPSSNNSENM